MHATLCDILYELVQNAVEAKATLITVDYLEDEENKLPVVLGHGCGMNNLRR